MSTYIPRKVESKIKEFIEKKEQYKNVLLIAGARQVGKSTLVKEVLKSYDSVISINLAENQLLIDRIDSTKSFKEFEEVLIDEFNFESNAGKILYIDEAQLSNNLGSYVRFMKENWRDVTVILSGSMLVELFKDRFPVGRVETIVLRPLSFEEFLYAQDRVALMKFLNTYNLKDKISDVRHESLLLLLEQYFLVGGLPEVVNAYREKKNWKKVRNQILNGYRNDFRIHFGISYEEIAWKAMKSVCYNVGSPSKYTHVIASNESGYKKVPEVIFRLESWHLLLNSEQKGEQPELDLFPKRYPLDIGITQEIRFTSRPQSLLAKNQSSDMKKAVGGLVETFVATEFSCLYKNLSGFKTSSYEIDFIISDDKYKIPVEIKASLKNKKQNYSSLLKYIQSYDCNLGLLLNMAKPSAYNFQNDNTIFSIPLYLIEQLPRLGFK